MRVMYRPQLDMVPCLPSYPSYPPRTPDSSVASAPTPTFAVQTSDPFDASPVPTEELAPLPELQGLGGLSRPPGAAPGALMWDDEDIATLLSTVDADGVSGMGGLGGLDGQGEIQEPRSMSEPEQVREPVRPPDALMWGDGDIANLLGPVDADRLFGGCTNRAETPEASMQLMHQLHAQLGDLSGRMEEIGANMATQPDSVTGVMRGVVTELSRLRVLMGGLAWGGGVMVECTV